MKESKKSQYETEKADWSMPAQVRVYFFMGGSWSRVRLPDHPGRSLAWQSQDTMKDSNVHANQSTKIAAFRQTNCSSWLALAPSVSHRKWDVDL